MKLGSVMNLATRDVKTIPPRSTIMNALKTMVNAGFRRMPVADAGTKKLMGIVSATDIINFLGGGEKHKIVENRYEGNLAKAINESIDEIMTRDVVSVRYTDSWEDAVELMIEKNVGGCPIVDNDGKVFGIVTERDIVKFLASQRRLDGVVRDYMTPRVVTVTPNTTVREAMEIMISKRIRRLPIVKDGILYGILVSTDFLRYFAKDAFKMLETGNIKDVLNKSIHEIASNSNVLKYREPLVFESRDKISDVVRSMVEKGVGCALIVENGKLEGIITERDLMKFLYSNI
ncbi:CBS domain-containing protein [Archaeoglobus profundus]|uniref:Signal transduction protein with CBS domains n=1 Tax=Archaeoglobus profundus (strain DSM 5631 / JCM 9629 / NBRC 100127 / Av18) TaxID=572546 RepID=D2RE11_ARCPA|nr:CBS domain-containing protein [Archaeoglobus profundus]ADB58355.1 putative signal transduction protein with CBS domains [Archaeoglobus profundus DSM 5631]